MYPKKILYISSSTTLVSGASHSLLALVKGVKARGIDPLVVFSSQGTAQKKFEEEGIECVVVPFFHNTYQKKNFAKEIVKSLVNRKAEKRIEALIKDEGVDLVHINGATTYIGARSALATQVPFVIHFREFLEKDLGFKYMKPKEAYSRISSAAAGIAVSKAVDEYVKERFALKKSVVVYNGVDVPSAKRTRSNKSVATTFSIVGRVFPAKGQLDAVKAFAELQNEVDMPLRLQIVGQSVDKDYRGQIQRVIDSFGIEDKVEFFDHTDDLEEIWASTDIGLMCSTNEAFGRVTAEYMANSILVIGANSGGTIDLLQEGRGLLYDPHSIDDLKDNMKRVLYADKDYWNATINKAYDFVRENCSENAYVDNVLEVYERIMPESQVGVCESGSESSQARSR